MTTKAWKISKELIQALKFSTFLDIDNDLFKIISHILFFSTSTCELQGLDVGLVLIDAYLS